MNINLKKGFAVILLFTLMLSCMGCKTNISTNYTDNSSDTNNSDTSDTDMDANKRLESLLEQLYEGQPYEEVCEILGGPGVDTASGMIRYEWIVDSNIKVIVYFNNIIYPNNYQLVVQSFRGEIIE